MGCDGGELGDGEIKCEGEGEEAERVTLLESGDSAERTGRGPHMGGTVSKQKLTHPLISRSGGGLVAVMDSVHEVEGIF